MTDIDPSKDFKGTSRRVDDLIKRLEFHTKVAEDAGAALKKNETEFRRLTSDLDDMIRSGRVSEDTVIGRGTPEQAKDAKTQEASASKEVEKATANTARSEREIAQTRAAASRSLSADLRAMRQAGDYSGSRALLARGATQSQIEFLRRQIAAGATGPTAEEQAILRQQGESAGTRGLARSGSAYGAAALQYQAAGAAPTKTAGEVVTQRALNREFARGVGAMSAYSTEMRRHGALTTEFIAATARGAVTVRELGYQVGSTIGKFGGWLVAGSAVFTALAAVQALGRGAIDSVSGVTELDRVMNQDFDTDRAQEAFRDLSKEFNLPIADVARASYGMAKVFQTLEDTLDATPAVLFAIKVGELDVATATRYLTAIVNGFNLPASQMTRIMDQLNEAQNRFGVSIPDTAAGVAKAAGTFRAAGGDFNTLLALITTAQKATGQTGEVIGTAIARSPNFLRRQDSQDVLRGFGIDPTDDIDRIYDRAFALSKRLGGEQRQVLAASILGPQYGARVGTPLFEQYDRYQKALRDTSPQAAAGSAQRELNTLLGSMRERLAAIGTSLEQLGSNLAESGILVPLDLALRTLQTMLDVTNALLGVFNELPGPVRAFATNLATAYGVIRLMRRLNVGSSFPEGSFGATQFTPPDLEKRIYKESLVQQAAVTNQELEEVGKRQAVLGSQVAIGQKMALDQQKLADIGGEIEDAELQQRALLERRTAILEQQALLSRGVNQAQIAAVYGVDPAVAGQVGREDARTTLRGIVAAPLPDINDAAWAQAYERRQLAIQALARESNALAARGRQMIQSGSVTRRAFGAATLTMGRIGGGLGSLGRTMGGFFKAAAASVGPLDLILGGAIAAYAFTSHKIDQARESAEQVEAVAGQTFAKRTAMLAAIEKARKLEGPAESYNLQERGQDFFGTPFRLLGLDVGSNQANQEQNFDTSREAIDRLKEQSKVAREALSKGELVTGGAIDYILSDDVEKALDNIVSRYTTGSLTIARFHEATNRMIRSIRSATNLSGQKKRNLISQVRSAELLAGGPQIDYADLAQLTEDDQQDLLDTYAKVIASGQAGRQEMAAFLRIGIDQMASLVKGHGIEGQAAALEAATTLTDSIKAGAEAELQRTLLFADTQQARDAAYSEYAQALSPKGSGEIRELRSQVTNTTDLLEQNRTQAKQLQRERDRVRARMEEANRPKPGDLSSGAGGGGSWGAPGPISGDIVQSLGKAMKFADTLDQAGISDAVGKIAAREEELTKQIRENRRGEDKLRSKLEYLTKVRKALGESLREAEREARRTTIYEAHAADITSSGGLSEARAPEGIARMREQMATINRKIKAALDAGFTGNDNILRDLFAERQGVMDSIFDYTTDLASGAFDLKIARTDPERTVRIANLTLQQANADLQRAQQQGDAKRIQDAAIIVAQAEQGVEDAIEERADALSAATFNLRRARAYDDPVRQAAIDLAEAQRNYSAADTAPERRDALAIVKERRHSLQEARAQREIEDVQFSADIGKLSLDAQIREYQRLLRTMTLTRDMRRDLRRRIYDLKQQLEGDAEGFDLAVGDIKLPTVYEIRRAIGGGINQGPTVALTVTNHNNVSGVSDPDAAVAKLGEKQKSAAAKNRNALRSLGVL